MNFCGRPLSPWKGPHARVPCLCGLAQKARDQGLSAGGAANYAVSLCQDLPVEWLPLWGWG